jgi:hypothetical protein
VHRQRCRKTQPIKRRLAFARAYWTILYPSGSDEPSITNAQPSIQPERKQTEIRLSRNTASVPMPIAAHLDAAPVALAYERAPIMRLKLLGRTSATPLPTSCKPASRESVRAPQMRISPTRGRNAVTKNDRCLSGAARRAPTAVSRPYNRNGVQHSCALAYHLRREHFQRLSEVTLITVSFLGRAARAATWGFQLSCPTPWHRAACRMKASVAVHSS